MTTKKLEHAIHTSPISRSSGKKIALINLRYPYEKNHIYMSGSLVVTAARFLEAGFNVEFIDLNTFPVKKKLLENPGFFDSLKTCDYIGISVTGAPSLPDAINLCHTIHYFLPAIPILLGGQVIVGLSSTQFDTLFAGIRAFRVTRDEHNLHRVLGREHPLTSPYEIPHFPAYNRMNQELLRRYLSSEMTLVISQGCKFACAFCAAAKKQREVQVRFDTLRTDLYYLAGRALQFGLDHLEFYASSLDFFQNPQIVVGHLEVLAEVSQITGIRIQVRCLSCMSSFLNAFKVIENFGELLKKSGIWCIGFGVDGSDVSVWKYQKKFQNTDTGFTQCVQLCKKFGIRAEMLMVLGFPQDTFKTLLRAVWNCIGTSIRYSNVVARPYLAKKQVPGNDEWENTHDPHGVVDQLMKNPNLFYNLDFCVLGSPLTHPNFFHRFISNAAYLCIILFLTPFGKCTTSPLLPQGAGGIMGWIAKHINRMMPFDR